MKKVLMVCGTFYPSSNPRAVQCTELYKELLRRGYNVDLCLPEKKQLLSSNNVKQLLKMRTSSEKYFIKEYSPLKGAISKAVCYFIGQKGFFLYYPWFKKNVRVNQYKAVIAISAPFYNVVLVGRLFKNHKETVKICDNGDPCYNSKQHSSIVKRIQIKAFDRMDYICFPIEQARKYYIDYADEKKFRVIPQGRNFLDISLKEYEQNEIPTFAYAGCFFMDIRNPESFLLMLCSVKIDFRFVLYTEISGSVYENILKKAKKKLGDKLIINSILPRLQCIYELSGMDFLINFDNLSVVQSPSKLIDYTLAGRPILSVRQDQINKDIFLQFLHGEYNKQTKIDLTQYDIKNVCQKYIDMIEENENG